MSLEEKQELVSKLQREILVESKDREALTAIAKQLPRQLVASFGNNPNPLLLKLLQQGWKPVILWTKTNSQIDDDNMELQDWLEMYTLQGVYTVETVPKDQR